MPSQKAAFEAASTLKRDEDYFREKIGSIKTADALVSDRRLLGVALGAFGLDADINNKFFIKKVLQDGTLTTTALSTKLADKQYQAFSAAFGFGDYGIPRTQLSDFADKILGAYKTRQFETAIGDQNSDMRLALNAERELTALAARPISEDSKWFTVMGSAPLRQVFQTAFGLPSSFAAIDLDQQLGTFKEKAEQFLGDPEVGQFIDPSKVDDLVKRFMVRSDTSGNYSSLTRGAGALQLLQASQQSTAAGILSLFR
ncbi:MAG: DUF1217 domain-containing protein [Paracoccaceae bacterium]